MAVNEVDGGRDEDPAAVGAAVAALWARHREENLARVTRLERAALALVEAGLGPAERAAALADAHKLAGAAGTYGFALASQAAHGAEVLLSRDDLTAEDGLRLMEIAAGIRGHLDAQAGLAPSESGAVLLIGLERGLAWETIARLTDEGLTGVPLEPHEDLRQGVASWRPGVVVIGPRNQEPHAVVRRIAEMAPRARLILLGVDPAGAGKGSEISAMLPLEAESALLVAMIHSAMARPAEPPPAMGRA